MGDITIELSFDSQDTWDIDVLGLFLDMLSMAVCPTRHKQTSSRPEQVLNVCTVFINMSAKDDMTFLLIPASFKSV